MTTLEAPPPATGLGAPLRVYRRRPGLGEPFWRWECRSCGDTGGGGDHSDVVSRALTHCAEHPEHRSSLVPPVNCRQQNPQAPLRTIYEWLVARSALEPWDAEPLVPAEDVLPAAVLVPPAAAGPTGGGGRGPWDDVPEWASPHHPPEDQDPFAGTEWGAPAPEPASPAGDPHLSPAGPDTGVDMLPASSLGAPEALLPNPLGAAGTLPADSFGGAEVLGAEAFRGELLSAEARAPEAPDLETAGVLPPEQGEISLHDPLAQDEIPGLGHADLGH